MMLHLLQMSNPVTALSKLYDNFHKYVANRQYQLIQAWNILILIYFQATIMSNRQYVCTKMSRCRSAYFKN